ncbi:bifunctional heptose 7-phosphate kinase/heptose 1-phosphate adenyltransferase [Anaeromyxobacter paludicola]|uniref:ADP-heptose synthase n=1 Tax=Anaeromyxobacter paludicola TaxID=2918171 RepID=A0ABN6N4R6_9BACT|nr:PfkB family carbohydrate kinase [Anaeromyxobacter paludicola]BDG08156.1 ADP-heptose synthase [Anaeromyxobacter paludicola]
MRRPAEVTLAALAPVVRRLGEAEAVVAGDLVADEYVYGETERISREAPVLIVRYERSELRAGAAANAAANLAALGVRVRLVGVVGEDAVGAALLEVLEGAGVDVSGVLRLAGRPTEVKTRILAGGRSTRRQQMLRVDRAPPPLPAAAERALAREVARAGRGARAALASDYGSGTLAPPVVEALRKLRARGASVCVDSRYQLASFAGLTTAKPNEPELEAVSGVRLDGPASFDRAARALLRKLGCEEVLVTRGRLGMSLYAKGEPPVHLRAHGEREAVDVTGAGDTVGAAFTAARAAGASALDAARLANVAGALVVAKPGTATVSGAELLRELEG